MQGTCPKTAQQVNCGAQTLDQLCPAPQTMMLPVQKRFLFLMRQRPIHPPQCPWVLAKLPSPHILTNPQILNGHSQLTFTAKCQRLQAEGQEGGLTSAFRVSLWREMDHLLHRCFWVPTTAELHSLSVCAGQQRDFDQVCITAPEQPRQS